MESRIRCAEWYATIGLGRALLSRLIEGIQWNVLAVNTHRPLFWFLGRGEVKSMDDLRGRRLAIHAPRTAPGCFARDRAGKHGLDPDRDVQCVVRAPGDYQMDLRGLRDGSINAAYVGSTLAPEQVAAEEGFSVLSLGWRPLPDSLPWESPWTPLASRSTTQALLAAPGAGQPASSFSRSPNDPSWHVDYIASILDRADDRW